jgi:hypothetical protein
MPVTVNVRPEEEAMSSKRFGKKAKKPKDKEKKKDGTVSAPALKSVPAPKAASFEQKHFTRRTSG